MLFKIRSLHALEVFFATNKSALLKKNISFSTKPILFQKLEKRMQNNANF